MALLGTLLPGVQHVHNLHPLIVHFPIAYMMGAGLLYFTGGLENPFGILVGGLLLGVIEKVAAVYNSSYQDGAAFVVILLLLVIRPSGLFGKKLIQKV